MPTKVHFHDLRMPSRHRKKTWYYYVLGNEALTAFYVGKTVNLDNRCYEHAAGCCDTSRILSEKYGKLSLVYAFEGTVSSDAESNENENALAYAVYKMFPGAEIRGASFCNEAVNDIRLERFKAKIALAPIQFKDFRIIHRPGAK